MIDKESKLPIYYQIEELIKARIENNIYMVDKIIPSERELMDQFGVSRHTIRQAIGNLVNEGYLYRVTGKGTFVKDRSLINKSEQFTSFTNDMESLGKKVENKIVLFRKENASSSIANRLSLDEHDPVLRIDRVRYVDQAPFAYEMLFVDYKVIGDVDEHIFEGSITKYYKQQLKLNITNATEVIEAVLAKEKTANLLNIETPASLLLVRTKLYTDTGKQVHYSKSYFIGNKYKITRKLTGRG